MPITTAERAERTYMHRGYRMGMEKGMRLHKIASARKMLERGMDIATIADLLEMSEDEVKELE